ncbi:MAG: ABC transporter ATP-binding protein [Chloroflexota bacterium]
MRRLSMAALTGGGATLGFSREPRKVVDTGLEGSPARAASVPGRDREEEGRPDSGDKENRRVDDRSAVLCAIEGVKKRYGNVEALRGLSLVVERGEALAILGPSGAGKTTTLKVIAGLEPVDSGRVYLNGRLVNSLEPKDRNVAMVFENYALYPNVTVFENLASSLYPIGMEKGAIAERVQQFAKILGIHHLLDRKPAQLSGGQKQRVALGRALVKPADLYLMDEPIAHLDAKLRHQMRAEFKHLKETLEISMVYVTHDWQEALSLGDHILVLNKGCAEQYGSKDDVFNYPKNTFVAQMIGDPPMNLIRGTIESDSGVSVFRANGVQLRLGAVIDPGSVILGIRPFRISLSSSYDSSIAAEVYASERHGMNTVATLTIDGQMLKMKSKGRASFKIGERIPLRFDLDGACIFDEQGSLVRVIGKN